MNNRLFIGGLSWETSSADLRTAFERFGKIEEARVITDRETGKSRGFGFVTFGSEVDAMGAMALDGQRIGGRAVRVNFAESRGSSGGDRRSTEGEGDQGRRTDGRRPTHLGIPQPEVVRRPERSRVAPPEQAFVDRSDIIAPAPTSTERDVGGAEMPRKSGRSR